MTMTDLRERAREVTRQISDELDEFTEAAWFRSRTIDVPVDNTTVALLLRARTALSEANQAFQAGVEPHRIKTLEWLLAEAKNTEGG